MEHFKSNKDYIKAVFTQFAKLPAGRSAPAPQVRPSLALPTSVKEPVTPPKSEYQKIREQLLEIYKCGREAVKNKINIPAERIAAKNKFDEIEKTIMLLALYLSAETRKSFWEERNGLQFIAKIFSLDTVDLYKHCFQDSRLNRTQLFSKEGFRDSFTIFKPLRLEIMEELLIENYPKDRNRVHPQQLLNTPVKIYKKLDETVIAQKTAKKKLSTIAFQHINRIKNTGAFTAPRLNVILIGPTGCGKTYIFVNILTNPCTSLFEHYRAFFRKNDIELEIPDEFAARFAEKAAARDLDARGLNAVVEGYFSNLVFDLMSGNKLEKPGKVNIMDYAGDKEFSALAA